MICIEIEFSLISSEVVRNMLVVLEVVVMVSVVFDVSMEVRISCWFFSRLFSGIMRKRFSV